MAAILSYCGCVLPKSCASGWCVIPQSSYMTFFFWYHKLRFVSRPTSITSFFLNEVETKSKSVFVLEEILQFDLQGQNVFDMTWVTVMW